MSPQDILNSVKEAMPGLDGPAKYAEYERAKQQLLSQGYYGYEKELADILTVDDGCSDIPDTILLYGGILYTC